MNKIMRAFSLYVQKILISWYARSHYIYIYIWNTFVSPIIIFITSRQNGHRHVCWKPMRKESVFGRNSSLLRRYARFFEVWRQVQNAKRPRFNSTFCAKNVRLTSSGSFQRYKRECTLILPLLLCPKLNHITFCLNKVLSKLIADVEPGITEVIVDFFLIL